MLLELHIRDLLLIERADLEFGPGLGVLTGETGAGKSVLLGALGFVLGWRGKADMVREGAAAGEVEAVFALPDDHAAHELLEELGIAAGDELVIRRRARPDGRKQGWINDRRVSGESLRALAARLVELHGQHDDRGLLDPRRHRALLDRFADATPALAATRAAWNEWQRARRSLSEAREALEAARAEADWLAHAVAELEAFAPEEGEEERLVEQRRLMRAGARRREEVARVLALLGDEGAEGHLADALRALEAAASDLGERADAAIAHLGHAYDHLADGAAEIAALLEDISFDPERLETVEERLFALRDLARKHKVPADELPALAQSLRARLDAVEAGDARLAALEEEEAGARRAFEAAAAELSRLRREAAGALDREVTAELPALRLGAARFRTALHAVEAGPEGLERAVFEVRTNPGAPWGPIDRIASGGELSRFLLALKVVLAGRGEAQPTMIFDEIDRGVGGATADAVGRRLAALARQGQVLVVTHSPQVAARADRHWRVMKETAAGRTRITVTQLDADERVEEIARMMAGETVTDQARAAARALLEG